jgi:hypothetical protein
MKKLFISLILLPVFSLAQECKNYYFMTKNSVVEMTVYDKKGKESGKQTWSITDVKKTGASYESTVSSSLTDEKGKEISKGTGIYKCDGGILKADIKMSLPQQQMEQYKDVEATMEPVYIEYPSSPSVGQTLADANFTMNTESKSGMKTTITFNETNRKIDSKESLTTSAGTWEAFVITYDSQFKAQLGPIGIPVNLNVKEWFVPTSALLKQKPTLKAAN